MHVRQRKGPEAGETCIVRSLKICRLDLHQIFLLGFKEDQIDRVYRTHEGVKKCKKNNFSQKS